VQRRSARASGAFRRSTSSTATSRRSSFSRIRAALTGRGPNIPQQTQAEVDVDVAEIVETVEAIQVTYKVGDKVVYPHHGAGKVLKKEKKEMLGDTREYLTIKILHNDMTVMVPSDSAGRAGLRRVIGEDDVARVLAVLRDDISQMPKNWNRRFKHNRDKMKTGDVFELAEVVRNLAIRDFEKGLSTGEKQMFTRAKKILSSELMYALDMDEKEAEEYLDDLLEESNTERTTAAK
jgi:CarD family transcriptional regulator